MLTQREGEDQISEEGKETIELRRGGGWGDNKEIVLGRRSTPVPSHPIPQQAGTQSASFSPTTDRWERERERVRERRRTDRNREASKAPPSIYHILSVTN